MVPGQLTRRPLQLTCALPAVIRVAIGSLPAVDACEDCATGLAERAAELGLSVSLRGIDTAPAPLAT